MGYDIEPLSGEVLSEQVASQHLRRFAAEQGVAAEAGVAGTEPDAAIPPRVRTLVEQVAAP
jgi:hypothetical protein